MKRANMRLNGSEFNQPVEMFPRNAYEFRIQTRGSEFICILLEALEYNELPPRSSSLHETILRTRVPTESHLNERETAARKALVAVDGAAAFAMSIVVDQ